jgi:hypothetical protein
MADLPLCDIDDCCQPAVRTVRFELVEPADPAGIVGTFTLLVCAGHSRPEFEAAS